MEEKKKTVENPPRAPNASQPHQVFLQKPFSNQGLVTQKQEPLPEGNGYLKNIYMNMVDSNPQT